MNAEMIEHVRSHPGGVVATVNAHGTPQAAYVAIAITERGELIFDAKRDSRKIANLLGDPRIAIVIGGEDSTTLQCEGTADMPDGDVLERAASAYLEAFPQFAESLRSGEIVVVRVRPTWVRLSDYRRDPPTITETHVRE